MTDVLERRPGSVYELLEQVAWWRNNAGEWVAVAAMSREHRLNTAKWLMRRVKIVKLRYEIAELTMFSRFGGPDDDGTWDFHDSSDPTVWLTERPLYRALVADLPESGAAYAALARRAKHWNTCPFRLAEGSPDRPVDATCTCAAPVFEAAAEAAEESTS